MDIDLILQYYHCPDQGRQEEIDTCLKHNLDNELISRVHLLTEKIFDFKAFAHCERITQRVIGQRLTFEHAFRYANESDPENRRIWLLANADIWFDGSLSCLDGSVLDGALFALTRHEVQQNGTVKMMIPAFAHGSQDAWIFKTPIPLGRIFSSFFLGIPGCDNRIAHEFIRAGYKVINPSIKILIYHLDLIRNQNIYERDKVYSNCVGPGNQVVRMAVPPPHQRYLYPVNETDPDSFEVYRSHVHHLSELGARIADQNDQIQRLSNEIAQQGDHMAKLYMEVEKLAKELARMRLSWSWKIIKPLYKIEDYLCARK